MLIIPANSLSGGFDVANSCRFNDGSSDYLNRTLGTATNKKKFTISVWFKKCNNSNGQYLASAGTDVSSVIDDLSIHSSQALNFSGYESGTTYKLRTNALLRDTSAWYHAVVNFDSTQGTDTNRLKMYINGEQITSFVDSTYPSLNLEVQFNKNVEHMVGRNLGGSLYMDGYMAEFCFIDGTALDPTSFGEFDEDSGIWKPIDVSGLTFGTNGFYLDFEDSAALGDDVSGNGNDFTVNNLTATDQTTDTCTNNFSTLNPLYQQGDNAFSEGNCKVVLEAGDGTKGVASNIAVSSGKWYFEVKQGSSTNSVIQVREASDKEDDLSYYQGSYAGYQFNNGNQYITGNSSSGYGASYADGDIIMVALDMDNDRVYFGKNGSWNDGDGNADEANLNDYAPVNGVTNAIAAFANSNGSATATAEFNFGNPPYANSSSVSDGNGFGNFEFAVPSGYFAICTKNLAEYG